MGKTGKMIYELLRDRILNDTYAPNESLVESSLAEELGVGRNTIRKALLLLEGENLIDMRAGKSATVKYLSKEEVLQLYEIRERLEGLIAYSCAKSLSDEKLKILHGYVIKMKENVAQQELNHDTELNGKFHKVLYEECPNRKAVELLENINQQLRRYKKRTYLIPGRAAQSSYEHEKIYDALANRNPDAAEEMVRNHIYNVRMSLEKNYDILS